MNARPACHDRPPGILALVMGELDGAAAEELNQHLTDCPTCQGVRDTLAGEEAALRSAFDALACSARADGVALAEWFGSSAATRMSASGRPVQKLVTRIVARWELMKTPYRAASLIGCLLYTSDAADE